MGGFKVISPPGPPGQSDFVVYDLEYTTAFEWHQPACRGEECWHRGLGPVDFLNELHERILRPAHYQYVSTPPGIGGKDSIRLAMGPGFFNQDETHLRETISTSS